MMAPYTIAHLKLSMAFKSTGFKYFNNRLGIYLTNSLEEADEKLDLFTGFGFAESIAEESKEAAQIKNDTPIMVVIGNPPYSISSSNKGEWITKLISCYKKDLNERNIQPLSDDYIKFIRYAEHHIEKNGSGIVAMITNNSFLDGIIHRQMRKHLLETFDEIYILDLHGNAKKKETAPDGSKDENVFDIMQGVAISIMIRRNVKKEKNGIVKFAELYGKREHKFNELNEKSFDIIKWKKLEVVEPNYFFVPKNFINQNEYLSKYFGITEIFNNNSCGIVSARDEFLVRYTKNECEKIVDDLGNFSEQKIKDKYKLSNDSRDWKLSLAISDIKNSEIIKIEYRPFDIRYLPYTSKSKGILSYPRNDIMRHMIKNDNLALIVSKQLSTYDFQHIFLTNLITDKCTISLQTKEASYHFPLYLYSEDGSKVPNLNQDIVKKIEKITYKTEPEEILDYIYAVLHSPGYRLKYKEFLKIDFPRVPYPKDKQMFNKFSEFGKELREIHLLESPKVNNFITTFPIDGSYEVEIVKYDNGNVIINESQYFGNVPEAVWNFYIGGYQPAQKWLKDRKGRTLTSEDIEHYQKIIVALSETARIMKEIDDVSAIILI
jgi:predicted helicase